MNRPRVLVVDDYEDGGLMQAYALEAAGFDVVTASGGLEALEETRRYRPAIVVMDIYMPHVDGLEATRRLKADPELRRIPVIAYTARPEAITLDGLFHSI